MRVSLSSALISVLALGSEKCRAQGVIPPSACLTQCVALSASYQSCCITGLQEGGIPISAPNYFCSGVEPGLMDDCINDFGEGYNTCSGGLVVVNPEFPGGGGGAPKSCLKEAQCLKSQCQAQCKGDSIWFPIDGPIISECSFDLIDEPIGEIPVDGPIDFVPA